MKNIIIFLHGKGTNKDDTKYQIVRDIADKKNIELVSINAPTPHKEGFKWFEKYNRLSESDVFTQFLSSVEFLKCEVDKILEEKSINYNDIIFCGHSQGALMAMYMGLTYGAKEIISLYGDFPPFLIKDNQRKNIPIYWIEAGLEDVLDESRKTSYKNLQNMGYNIKYFLSPNSNHNSFEKDILDIIK